MNDLSPIYLELLTKHGILENAPKVHISPKSTVLSNTDGTPQQPTVQNSPPTDVFSPRNNDKFYQIKTYGAIGLLVYLAGVICAKGKLNPIDGAKGIYNLLATTVSKFCKIFKKP